MPRKYTLTELLNLKEKFRWFQGRYYLKTPIDYSASQFILWLEMLEDGIIDESKLCKKKLWAWEKSYK